MINVVFFAALREQLNCNELSIDNDNINTVAEVKEYLANTDDHWRNILSNGALLSAVNHEMVKAKHIVKSGDEVAFFPPVTGG